MQAVLGWSVTALFGRLPSMKQTALSVALLMSLVWPLTIVGVFVPSVSAWAFAFVPLHKWLGARIVRWITLGLVLAIPLLVDAVTHWVAPSPAGRGRWRAILAGYPLTLGYALACLVTAVTVPLVRLASATRGWRDEHVFVQPRAGQYGHAIEELAAACAAAGVEARIEPVPGRMRIASTTLIWFARRAVNPIVAAEPKVLRATGLELYLYPADLLIRGTPVTAERVRAALTRTWLERYAFTVADPGAQKLQDELQRLWSVVQRHANPRTIGRTARSRLREIARDLDRTGIPFDQWVTLDRSLYRLEKVLGGGADLLENDQAVRSLRTGDGRSEREQRRVTRRMAAGGEPLASDSTPLGDLVVEALDETRELARLEVALAREDFKSEITKAKTGALTLAGAAAAAPAGIALCLVALAATFPVRWLAALVLGGALLVVATAAGLIGWRALPKRPMLKTRGRLQP